MVRNIRNFAEIPDAAKPDEAVWRPVTHHLGIHAFGINAWTARGLPATK